MTAPHEPHDPDAEFGSTQQFKAFVQHNDAPDEARERASVDPDGPRAPVETDRAPAQDPQPPATDREDDREIQFSDPVQSGPPVHSLRPDVDLPPAELGSTAQFRAFARGDESATDQPAPSAESVRVEPPTAAPLRDPSSGLAADAGLPAPALPPADPSGKRNLLIALAVILLVVIAVVLLFVLV